MSEVIGRGAEAILTKEKWDSLDCVTKQRIEKKYRVENLDVKLRRERTKQETKLLSEARRIGVSTPQVYEKEENIMKMEYLDGERLRDLIPGFSSEELEEISREIGRDVAKLHGRGIIHGDLTTSNMIMVGCELYFIDFGLGFFSNSIEDKAVDLYLLWEVLTSTHSDHKEKIWKNIKKGYETESENYERVFERVKDIGARGRYVSDR